MDAENDLVFEDDTITWNEVGEATGAGEILTYTRQATRARSGGLSVSTPKGRGSRGGSGRGGGKAGGRNIFLQEEEEETPLSEEEVETENDEEQVEGYKSSDGDSSGDGNLSDDSIRNDTVDIDN